MHFIVDLENVNSAGLHGSNLLTDKDFVTIFYGIRSDCICREYMEQLIGSGCSLEYIKVESQRKNALDFYVTAYIAEVHIHQEQRKQSDRIAIISKDKDFQTIREYWEKRGTPVFVGKTIIGAIAAYDAGERRKQAERLLQNVHIDEMMKRKSLSEQVRAITNGPETDEIITMIERQTPARKMYIALLHMLGQKRGLEVYRKVKEISGGGGDATYHH